MGYALFASRKLMLTNSINMLNLELTDIMNKRMDLTELGSAVSDGEITSADIAGCKQAGLACEYGLDMYSTKITKVGDPEYQAGLISAEKEARQNIGLSWGANIGGAAAGAAAGAAIGSVVPVIGTALGAVIGGIGGAIIGNKCSKKTQARDEYVNDYKEQYEANKKEQMARDIQEQIAKMENQLEKRQKTIETKIQAYQSDLEATEKAEANAIKNATPKYAGVQG